jgi:hypothetical protein
MRITSETARRTRKAMSSSDKLLPPGGSAAENLWQARKKSPAMVRGRYIGQIRGTMALVKGRRYEEFTGSEEPRVNRTHADAVEKRSDISE